MQRKHITQILFALGFGSILGPLGAQLTLEAANPLDAYPAEFVSADLQTVPRSNYLLRNVSKLFHNAEAVRGLEQLAPEIFQGIQAAYYQELINAYASSNPDPEAYKDLINYLAPYMYSSEFSAAQRQMVAFFVESFVKAYAPGTNAYKDLDPDRKEFCDYLFKVKLLLDNEQVEVR